MAHRKRAFSGLSDWPLFFAITAARAPENQTGNEADCYGANSQSKAWLNTQKVVC